jgi:hypothetical protein
MLAMTRTATAMLAIGFGLAGCVQPPAPPAYAAQVPPPRPLFAPTRPECLMIYDEIARQERIAALSGVMSTALVEASARLNAANVIAGLRQRAAIEGCG